MMTLELVRSPRHDPAKPHKRPPQPSAQRQMSGATAWGPVKHCVGRMKSVKFGEKNNVFMLKNLKQEKIQEKSHVLMIFDAENH